jgi:hypothetical protein
MNNKVEEYLMLKEQYAQLLKQPIGNRIKEGGLLEQKIKQVFSNKRAEEVLKRTENYNFEEYQNVKNRLFALKQELEEEGILTYSEEGEEILA